MNAYVRFVWKRWFSSKRNIVLLGLLVAIELVSLQMMSGMDRFTDPVPISDPVAVLCGNAGVSYLSGLCVLGFYTLVLFLLNGLLIRKHA